MNAYCSRTFLRFYPCLCTVCAFLHKRKTVENADFLSVFNGFLTFYVLQKVAKSYILHICVVKKMSKSSQKSGRYPLAIEKSDVALRSVGFF